MDLSKHSLAEMANIVKTISLHQLHLLANTSTRKKTLYLTLGATVALVSRLAFKLFYVPRSLRHLPCVDYFSFARTLLKNEDGVTRTQKVFAAAMEKGNGIFVACYPAVWSIHIAEPMAAKALLMRKDKFPKFPLILMESDKGSSVLKYFGVDSLPFVNGEVWRNQRKIINPAFQRSMPVHVFGTLMQKGFGIIEQRGYQVPIMDFFQRLTLDAIGIAGFGFDFGAIEDPKSTWPKTYNVIRTEFKDPSLFMFPRWDWLFKIIFPGRRELDRAIDKLNALLISMAQQKRKQLSVSADTSTPENEKDLLTLMLEAHFRKEGIISDEELRGNLALFFMAGHETTTNALSFCVYNLAMNQDAQEKARKEVLHIFGDEPQDVLPTLEELRQMSYLDMVLKENLRMFPPESTLLARVSYEDTEINGVFIPKNIPIIVEVEALHYNPKVWKNPEMFDPERFAPDGENKTNSQGTTWLPFSSGTRACIGMNFTLTEQRTFLAMLLHKYTWKLPDDSIHKHGVQIGSFLNIAPDSLDIEFHPRY